MEATAESWGGPLKRKRLSMTVGEVCERLGISRTTVYRWIKTDRLPSWKIGPRRLFNPLDVTRLIDAGTEDLLTTEEACSWLHCDTKWLQRLIDAGEIRVAIDYPRRLAAFDVRAAAIRRLQDPWDYGGAILTATLVEEPGHG